MSPPATRGIRRIHSSAEGGTVQTCNLPGNGDKPESDNRPAGNGPVTKSLSCYVKGNPLSSLDVVDLVAYVGAVSREIGYRQAEDDMAARWATVAAKVRAQSKAPFYSELTARRGENFR